MSASIAPCRRIVGGVTLCLAAAAHAGEAPETGGGSGEKAWASPAHPYRVSLTLERPADAPAVIDLPTGAILDAAAGVSVDRLDQDSFAFENAVLINPATGAAVGHCRLVRSVPALDIDGAFAALRGGGSPWTGFDAGSMFFEAVEIDGNPADALMLSHDEFANRKLTQPVELEADRRYLLDYWITMDPRDYAPTVAVRDPRRSLFNEQPHSYVAKLTPPGRWVRQRKIIRPASDTSQLEVAHSFTGRAGVAELRLQPVEWRLIVEPDAPTDRLDLYFMARAGHRLTIPTDELIRENPPAARLAAESIGGLETHGLNPEAVRVAGDGIEAWTVDPALPLKVGKITAYRPAGATPAAQAARVDVFRGGAASLVIALDAGRPRADSLLVTADFAGLPMAVRFNRLATVPVYDGPTVDDQVRGQLLDTRYDPLVPLDYALDPDSADGVHLVVVTFTPTADTPPGRHAGHVRLTLGQRTLRVPVSLRVAPIAVAPQRHFGSLLGSSFFLAGYPAGVAGLVRPSIPMAAFHGLDTAGLSPPTVMSLSIPDRPDPRTAPTRALAERYFHTMLDHHLLPQSPAMYAYFNYRVQERGEGLAPRLTDWDFSHGYDRAIREFVLGRDMPWLLVGRSNGRLIDRITLNNGKTYSDQPQPENPDWVHLPREPFDQLVGDFWDAFARHLDTLGVLDRAVIVLDDSPVDSYDNILAFARVLRSRPHAQRIRLGYTIQKTSAFTRRLADGRLLMDEALGLVIPFNDDMFNFFEPSANARFEKPGQTLWMRHNATDHVALQHAGLSTAVFALKAGHFGGDGWYYNDAVIWSMPFGYREDEPGSFEYANGPTMNPWRNPFYHHGPGAATLFYPPDPRGPAVSPTNLVVPSFRLALIRDGIQHRALLDVLRAGVDDAGRRFAINPDALAAIESDLRTLWADNPVQWYLSYPVFRDARRKLFDLVMKVQPQ